MAAASVLALIGPVGPITALQWTGLAINLAIAVTGIALVLTRPPGRLFFQLIIAAALIDVILLAFAGDRLLA